MTWFLTALSIYGVWLNINKRRSSFLVWMATNFCWSAVDYYHGLYAQSALFAVYFLLACYGLYEWRNHA